MKKCVKLVITKNYQHEFRYLPLQSAINLISVIVITPTQKPMGLKNLICLINLL